MQKIASLPFTSIASFPELVKDYLNRKKELHSFYNYEFSLEEFGKVMDEKRTQNLDRNALHSALIKQYSKLQNSEFIQPQIDSFLSAETFTVTAAHQPCLFLGPVFNVYKIAATINLTRQLKSAFPQKHFVPVFWMGSEDHDWEELGHTNVYGKTINWMADDTHGAVGRIPTGNFATAIASLQTILGEPGTEIVRYWSEVSQKHTAFGTMTQQYIHDLFGKYGLVVINQDDADLKRLFIPVMKSEIVDQTANAVLKENLAQLSVNYKLQVVPREINFFYLQKNSRKRIVKESSHFKVLDTSVTFSKEQLVEEINAHPGRFSPNVVMRPLYQEIVLPNLAFVGGAGELSYWLELKPLFEQFSVNFPMLAMRPAFTILNASQFKKWQKLQIPLPFWFGDVEDLIKYYVKSQSNTDLSLESERQQLESTFDALSEKAAAIDVTLKGAVDAEKQKALQSLQIIAAKLMKAEKKKQEEGVNQIRNLHQQLFPEGNWQERSENVVGFQLQHPDFIDQIINLANPFEKSMLLLA
ncbi:MAG: bacillithiol biosynthesis cysteine-adding enzyme BshC [Chitinophagales bacterium]